LIQLLLPLHDNERKEFSADEYTAVRSQLTERFGGLTVYTRAPAVGLWKPNGNEASKDDIVIFEVMAGELDVDWWHSYKHELEARFRQQMLVIRAQETRML
ncbi:MAG: hypothetical protein M3Z64_03950, partial [Verrucomicrobiota bacterium]|nr:hypothetical protein [Verrucomicrobiota bacterium]